MATPPKPPRPPAPVIPLTTSQRALAEQYVPLALWTLWRKFGHLGRDRLLDLQDVAELALCEAARKFDPARGVLFKTFAVQWIWGRVGTHLSRNLDPVDGAVSLHTMSGRPDLAPGLDPPDRERECEVETADEFRGVRDRLASLFDRAGLSPRERDVLEMSIGHGRTLATVAARWGITKEWVRQLVGKAMRKVRVAAGILSPDAAADEVV